MRCPECGEDLHESARFCHQCGAEIAKPAGERSRRRSSTKVGPKSRVRRVSRKSSMADRDETVLWTGSFSAKGLIHSWLLAGLISIVLPVGGVMVGATPFEWTVILGIIGIVWLGLGLLLLLQQLNVHYELTDQRLIHRSGILLRRTNRIELIDMDDVSHQQGLIERLFDVGTIEIASSDRSHPLIRLPGISDVEDIAMLIDDARRRERIRRGIHIEQI